MVPRFPGTHLPLKGNICIRCERFPSAYFALLPRGDGLPSSRGATRISSSSKCVCVCVGLSFRIIHFSPYLFIIRQFNKCEVCSVMLDHPSEASDLGSVYRAPSKHNSHFPIPHTSLSFIPVVYSCSFSPLLHHTTFSK